jgi:ankyrin repeat protein
MGQKVSHKANSKVSTIRELQEQPLSDFYLACRDGDIEIVKNLLPSMSIERINWFEPNGSTALHAASYHGHTEIVRILLVSDACRSLRNLRYNLTPYEEARNDDIRRLFSRINLPSQARFIGSSSKTEWSLDRSQAAEWKRHLSK